MRVYSDAACERHVNAVARVEAEARFPAALSGVALAEKAGVPVERCPCEPAPEEAVARVHSPEYLDRLRELSAAGGGYLGPDVGLNEHSWEAAVRASGAAVAAVESALSGTAAFAVVRPPGHHAGADYGMGFCLLNHAAVAAEYARSAGVDRVAVLDWDVHHGNGTQDLFYADGEVLYLSVHRSPFYPGTGAARETGEAAGRGLTVNVPLPARSGAPEYAAAFEGILLPVLREFRPGLVVVSAGYDAHAADPLGGMLLGSEDFGRFAAAVAALAREIGAAPPALVLEGGYDLDALAESVAATILGITGAGPAGWERVEETGPVGRARETLSPFWESLR